MWESWDEHNKRLRAVLTRMRESGLTLRVEKCKFGVREISYLGHLLTEEGVRPKPDMLKSIENLSAPTNKEEVMPYLGMLEFYKSAVCAC